MLERSISQNMLLLSVSLSLTMRDREGPFTVRMAGQICRVTRYFAIADQVIPRGAPPASSLPDGH